MIICILRSSTYHIIVRFSIHAMGKHSNHKQIDNKGHKQSYRCLYKEVEIRFAYFLRLATIYIAGLLTETRLNTRNFKRTVWYYTLTKAECR